MNINYTALALIVDRSGSMQSLASDVVGSIKQFIGDQKKNPGKASLTVVQFDHAYDVVYDFKNITEVDEEKFADEYAPRGSTALLDAIGRTTLAMNQKLNSLSDADKPQRVVVAVITDGLENASTEFNIEQIKDMIKDKETLGWDFMFLGATLDAIDVAQKIGFSKNKSAVYAVSKVGSCIDLLNQKITCARRGEGITILDPEREALIT